MTETERDVLRSFGVILCLLGLLFNILDPGPGFGSSFVGALGLLLFLSL